ncbi:MAG: PhzF family phenazine biosynthesis protein, partial [Elusimicrobiota bacterium]
MSWDFSFPVFFVDAFASRPFTGNPAAVCLLPKPVSRRRMQALAKEIGFSETAFLLRERGGYRLRWFTPTVEEGL